MLSYQLDDIYITDANSASSTIKNVEGGSAKFLLENGIIYSTLNNNFFLLKLFESFFKLSIISFF